MRESGDCPSWFLAAATLPKPGRACIKGFAASFQKTAAMDFYMTKNQGKLMEAFTPLFISITSGIHRLEKSRKKRRRRLPGKLLLTRTVLFSLPGSSGRP